MSSQNLMKVIILRIIDTILETHHEYIPKAKLFTQYNSNIKALYLYTKCLIERAMLASIATLKDDKDEESKIQKCQMSKSNNKRNLMKVSNYGYKLQELHKKACSPYAQAITMKIIKTI